MKIHASLVGFCCIIICFDVYMLAFCRSAGGWAGAAPLHVQNIDEDGPSKDSKVARKVLLDGG